MTIKQYWPYLLGLIVVAFIIGRYSAPEKIKIEKNTDTASVDKKDTNLKKDQIVTKTEVLRPNGTKITKTKTEYKEETDTSTTKAKEISTQETKTIQNRSGVLISALVGLPLSNIAAFPVIGGAFSVPVILNIEFGGWFLPINTTFGISAGARF